MTFSAVFPLRLVSTLNDRSHWAVKAKRAKEHRKVGLLIPKHPLPCVVTITRIAPRALDSHDNMPGSAKNVVDGIADRLGIKDNDPRVEWRYTQEKGKPHEYAVRVEITEDAL